MAQDNPLVDVWKRIEAGEKLIIEKNLEDELVITFVTPGSVTKECWKSMKLWKEEETDNEQVWEMIKHLLDEVDKMMSHKHIYNPKKL